MSRPICQRCDGRPMVLSDDGDSYYCHECHEYLPRDETDIEMMQEKKMGA